jgi:hypothetical protein
MIQFLSSAFCKRYSQTLIAEAGTRFHTHVRMDESRLASGARKKSFTGTVRCLPWGPDSSTPASYATNAVAGVEAWTMADRALSKIAWYWFSPSRTYPAMSLPM